MPAISPLIGNLQDPAERGATVFLGHALELVDQVRHVLEAIRPCDGGARSGGGRMIDRTIGYNCEAQFRLVHVLIREYAIFSCINYRGRITMRTHH